MQSYRDLSGRSGVRAFETGPARIDVRFVDGSTYRYDRHRPGAVEVRTMRRLAHAGRGLATYINRHVRTRYARRLG